jgi:hypothetical protein
MPLYSILNNQQRSILQMPLFISLNSGICFSPLMQQPVSINSSTSIGHEQLLDTVMLPRYQLRHLIVSNQLNSHPLLYNPFLLVSNLLLSRFLHHLLLSNQLRRRRKGVWSLQLARRRRTPNLKGGGQL